MAKGVVLVHEVKFSPGFGLEEFGVSPSAVAGSEAGAERILIEILTGEEIRLCSKHCIDHLVLLRHIHQRLGHSRGGKTER